MRETAHRSEVIMQKLQRFQVALQLFPIFPSVYDITSEQFDAMLLNVKEAMGEAELESDRAEVLKLGLGHSVWQIRAATLEAAAQWHPLAVAEEAILKGTHDSVDVVAFQAIKLCGKLRIRPALTHLSKISGWPSSFSRPDYLRKPVGIGAALTKQAMMRILGSEQHEELVQLEAEYMRPFEELKKEVRPKPDTSNMVFIGGGPCVIGSRDRQDFTFEYHDYVPEITVDVPAFYIDAKPVTNRDYVQFARAIGRYHHVCCHHDERPDKDHWPSHIWDPRFGGADMPVTGIDWYDAYSYAAWHGKKLPSEIQWEKAARGVDGRDYPWGNEWRPELANYVESAFGQKIEDLAQWEDLLRTVSRYFPPAPVWPVGSQPGGNSPYGVSDMAGNVWEWTETNFISREPMDPFFKGRDILSFTNRAAAFPVIRGGCWTSLPEMLRTFYRGKDLLTDRHFEIGFRCTAEA